MLWVMNVFTMVIKCGEGAYNTNPVCLGIKFKGGATLDVVEFDFAAPPDGDNAPNCVSDVQPETIAQVRHWAVF